MERRIYLRSKRFFRFSLLTCFLSMLGVMSLHCSPNSTSRPDASSQGERAETEMTHDKETISDSGISDVSVSEQSTPEPVQESSPKEDSDTDKGTPIPCQDDCDCIVHQGSCIAPKPGEAKSCQPINRPNLCPKCEGNNCPQGKRCVKKGGSLGVCPAPSRPCKHDCDCVRFGLLCDSGTCKALRRVSKCLSCKDINCQAGQPCQNPDKSIGTCGKGRSCKDDCDCPKQMACLKGQCRLARVHRCPDCASSNCPKGSRCRDKAGSIGTCSGSSSKSCKHDCDCVKFGLLCDVNASGVGTCRPLRRLSKCLSCKDINCQAGQPCQNPDKSIGKCGGSSKPCKSDCDCTAAHTACVSGACRVTRKINSCLKCNDPKCPTNSECIDKNGKKGFCCCTVSGCGKGLVCCPGGVKPPPGKCGSFCTKPDANGRCLPRP